MLSIYIIYASHATGRIFTNVSLRSEYGQKIII